ncbi:MAG: hypothetical protein B6I25_04485 [Planctomycetales bacterium 4572_13]|nr:MAG: hypothetical protein B6I25_04485 [Planctomycetales bacterium 4572_13]
MAYSSYLKNNLAIGSGVTEAACKVLIKQRMCISGSRWKDEGAQLCFSPAFIEANERPMATVLGLRHKTWMHIELSKYPIE